MYYFLRPTFKMIGCGKDGSNDTHAGVAQHHQGSLWHYTILERFSLSLTKCYVYNKVPLYTFIFTLTRSYKSSPYVLQNIRF